MLFIDAISHQHLCVPRCDCMGLVCSLTIDTGGQLRQLKVGFYLNLDTEEFEFLYAGDLYKLKIDGRFLAHLSRRLTGELIVYPCSGVRPSSSVRPSIRRPKFQRSSPLKPLGQSKPNFMWSILSKEERKFI